ncbi:tetratricopeptide repeat protein [Marinilongibacter aquaticus]|uniref:tetratricopeptide repeat protein n=1 Tax=Marinilongibacter aquaticus TaxID=2975157 RepID=UPI0021BD3BC0|nr:tetratricopeptide repeat protein [Marinilongibacter aquaticus]UBM57932.1 tetratricopeptide repeat protein [Marinilongibacter aquaticus]
MHKRIFLYFFCLFGIGSQPLSAQFLNDELAMQQTREALDKIYNFEFTEAEHELQPLYSKYKDHPVSHLLRATWLYWKYRPVAQNAVQAKAYLNELEKCIALGERLIRVPKYKAEATFYLLSAHGFISKFHHFNHDYIKAAFEAKNAYSYLKDGFDYMDVNPDFLFTSGLYQYYREQYPESHPQVKPIVYFFKEGNKAEGLVNMRRAVKVALFSQVEAADYLGGICLKYESRNREALQIYSNLHKKYPKNPDFLLRYIEVLAANGLFDDVQKNVGRLRSYSGSDYQVAYHLFKGEFDQHRGEFDLAKKEFLQCVELEPDGYHTDDMKAAAYLQLGKIAFSEKRYPAAKQYLKACLDLAGYKSTIAEAESIIKQL